MGGKQRGSALLATLCFAAVLSLSLASYLAVCYRSLVLSNRTMHSTHSIELAEVGMEEALWALNNTGGFDASWSHPVGTTAVKVFNGFSYENSATGAVTVTIENYMSANPTITTVGSITLGDHSLVTRTLKSDAHPAPLFTKAIGALGNLVFNFGGTIDSYNSSIAAYTPTVPGSLTPANSAAVIAAPDMTIGTAQVYGFAVTNAPTVPDPTPFLYENGAKVIGPDSVTSVDPSRRGTNYNQPVYDPVDPTGGSTIPPVTATTTLSAPGVYRVDSINLTTDSVNPAIGAELIITAPVVLVVTNSVQTSGLGQITIQSGGSLVLQIDENDGQGLNLQGSGIVNQTQLPQNLSVIVGGNYTGNPVSNIDVSNNFYGSIYLPKDDLSVSNNTNIYGAVIAKNVTFTGTAPAFHYDSAFQNISTAFINAPFTLIQLRETTAIVP